MNDNDERRPAPRIFAAGEVNAFLNEGALPCREDDTPVFAGQSGPRRRATPEELRAFVEEEIRRHTSEGE